MSSFSFCLVDGDSASYPFLSAAGIAAINVTSDEGAQDYDVVLVPGLGDLASLQRVQALGQRYPKKPIILVLSESEEEQETAAIELGAFEIWSPDTKYAPALARLRNQLNMLRATSVSHPRKKLHSPFLRRKQRLLQTLLNVVERPDEFRLFVDSFFTAVEHAKTGREDLDRVLERLNAESQEWGLDFLYKRLKAQASADDISQADKDLRTFIKTHQKLLQPILTQQDL